MLRVLIATIRNNGDCPCPRCLVQKADIPNLGKILDMRRRTTKARHDDEAYREKVREARALIYEGKYVVNSKKLDRFMQSQCLVPTRVFSIS